MSTTNKPPSRGRPRRFQLDEAIATAQHLFHARGYDALSVAEVTDALGIKPPSFYAAFGNKMGLFTRVLERYSETGAIHFSDLLRPDRPVADSLAALLEEAAIHYAGDSSATGCLVLEGSRCNDPDARKAACAFQTAAEEMIRLYIAERHPDEAERVTDFVSTTMAGLSAKARSGYSLDRLRATARIASLGLAQTLEA